MGLRFDPIGGGQFKQALQQIIEAERQPIKQLEGRKKVEESRMKLFQEFKSKFSNFDKTLSEFANFRKFRELKVDLGDGDKFVDVTIDKDKAEPGSYQIEIDQAAKRSSIISNGFESADEAVLGLGFVVIPKGNGDSKEIFVDDKNASLRKVAALINAEKDSGVQASVINDQSDEDRPWKLIVSAKKDGQPNQIDFPEFYFMDGDQDLYIDDHTDAENALLKVNGYEIEAGSNDIKDFLTGVNLFIKRARPDDPITLKIGEDYQKISGKVKAMVDQVNGILEFINKQNQIDDKSDTKGTFAGDSSLQTIEYRLRNLMHEGFPSSDPNTTDSDDLKFIFGNNMGIEFQKDGSLKFSEEKFTKALQDDFLGMAEAISGSWGMAAQMRQVLQGYTRQPDGMIQTREKAIQQRIKTIDDQIAQKERRVDQKQEALVQQFSRLQSSLSNLQRQQQYLSSVMPSGGGGNLVAQLLGG